MIPTLRDQHDLALDRIHNGPQAFLPPAAHYERLVTNLEDLEHAARVRERSEGPFVEVSLDNL